MDPKPLWLHQAKTIGAAIPLRDFAIFHEAGTGKTRTMIQILRRRYADRGRLMRTVVLCPKVVMKNWRAEILEFSKVDRKDIVLLEGSEKKRIDLIRSTFGGPNQSVPGNKVFITNYEGMQMRGLQIELLRWQPEILVCDESHRCKNMKSKRAMAVADLAGIVQHRYIMTGTPVLQSAMDLFMQFKILDGGETFGHNFYAFRGRYFEDANNKWAGKPGYFPKWEPRPEAYFDLSDRIRAKSSSVKKAECLDLPPFVRKLVEVEMSPEQRRLYEEMKKELITYIKSHAGENQAVVAQLAVTKALRLQQIVSGFVKTDGGQVIAIEDVPRLEALEDLLEDLVSDHKVIIWAVFKENYRRIGELLKKMGLEFATITGDTQDKDAEIERFRKNPRCQMLANPGAGGIGINLVESDNSIYYSKGFNLEHDIQSEARNYRGGSERHKSVTRTDLICRGSIDELVHLALMEKADIGQKILGWAEEL